MRIGLATLLAIPLTLVVGACATSEPSSATEAVSHFASPEVSFDYPAQWGAARFNVNSTFSSAIVFLATSPLRDPCDRGPNSIACVREAATALAPDGLLVTWSGNGFPGWVFDPTKGRRIIVAGRPATVEEMAPSDVCRSIGGDTEIVVTIPDPAVDHNWTEMRACVRGPDVGALDSQISAMLGSVRWHT